MDFDVNTLTNMMSMFGNSGGTKAGAAGNNTVASSQLSSMLPMLMNILGGANSNPNASNTNGGNKDGQPYDGNMRNSGGDNRNYGNGSTNVNGRNDRTNSSAYSSNFARINGIGEPTDAFVNNTDDNRRAKSNQNQTNNASNGQNNMDALSNLLPMLMNLTNQKPTAKAQETESKDAQKTAETQQTDGDSENPGTKEGVAANTCAKQNENVKTKKNEEPQKPKPRFFNDLRERVDRGRVKKRLPEKCSFSTVSFAGEEINYALRRLNYGLNANR